MKTNLGCHEAQHAFYQDRRRRVSYVRISKCLTDGSPKGDGLIARDRLNDYVPKWTSHSRGFYNLKRK